MDVSNWPDAPQPVLPGPGVQRFLSPVVIGVTVTLVLHAFIAQSIYLASRADERHLPENLRLTQINTSSSSSSESLSIVNLLSLAPASKGAQVTLDEMFSPSLLKQNPVLTDIDMPHIENSALALNEDEGSESSGLTKSSAENSRLVGIYTGQIRARIERVWRRPRSPVIEKLNLSQPSSDESFQCEAQIVQDAAGNVQEILLPRCNGSAAWQRSLVIAIQQASPLPAPPEATVFVSSINLEFVAFPYGSGGKDDEYELSNIYSVKN